MTFYSCYSVTILCKFQTFAGAKVILFFDICKKKVIFFCYGVKKGRRRMPEFDKMGPENACGSTEMLGRRLLQVPMSGVGDPRNAGGSELLSDNI